MAVALLKSKRCLGGLGSAIPPVPTAAISVARTEPLQYVLSSQLPFLLTSKVFKVRRSMGAVVYMASTPSLASRATVLRSAALLFLRPSHVLSPGHVL